jgi:transcriptional regulator of arginine metabolism
MHGSPALFSLHRPAATVHTASTPCLPSTSGPGFDLASKTQRHNLILRILDANDVPSQEVLRDLLAREGLSVAQGTLSRDIRELGLAKIPNAAGVPVYTAPPDVTDPTPSLSRLLPPLFIGADGVGNLLILKTVPGGAQPIAVALDHEEWQEIVGTVAGDDTILLVLRKPSHLATVRRRLERLAGVDAD